MSRLLNVELGSRSLQRAVLLGLLVAMTAVPVGAQSLFNAAGLGLPIEAMDGRSRAMGSMGIGLDGSALIPTDPGALAWMRAATGVMVSAPSWVDYSADGGQTGSFQGNRFPLLGIAYPLLGGMASIQIGSFLDQTYEVSRTDSVTIGGVMIPTQDDFRQDGSISNLNLGFSRVIAERFSVGVTLGRYAGSLDRTFERVYGDPDAEDADARLNDVDSYREAGVWSWTGNALTLGGTADVNPSLRVAASVQIPSGLDAAASAETRGVDRSFSLPVQYRLGATASVGESIMVHGSALLADWSSTADDLAEGAGAHDATGFGLGVELARARLFGKSAPLRFGYRTAGLPFTPDGAGARERIFSGGFGLSLNETAGTVLAGIDIAVERGRRSGGSLTENFWRGTLSLFTSGF